MYFGVNSGIELPTKALSESELLNMYKFIVEDFEAVMEAEDKMYSLEEGANTDIHNKFKEFKKEYKDHYKEAKKALKDGDKAKAKEYVKKLYKDLEDIEKFVKSVDYSDTGSVVFGYFVRDLLELARYLPLLLIPILGPAAAMVLSIKDDIEDIVQTVKNFQKGEDASTALNLYRTHIMRIINTMKTDVKKIEKQI